MAEQNVRDDRITYASSRPEARTDAAQKPAATGRASGYSQNSVKAFIAMRQRFLDENDENKKKE